MRRKLMLVIAVFLMALAVGTLSSYAGAGPRTDLAAKWCWTSPWGTRYCFGAEYPPANPYPPFPKMICAGMCAGTVA